MTIVDRLNALDLLDAELTRINNLPPSQSRKPPMLLYLKNGYKARIRPLLNLNQVVVLNRHNKYSPNIEERGNAICGKHIDKECKYCLQEAEGDQDLRPKKTWYIPVYVYGIQMLKDVATGKVLPEPVDLTYEDKDKNKMYVRGYRVLELDLYGANKKLLTDFSSYAKDEDYDYTITNNDFVMEQNNVVAAGQKKAMKTITLTIKPNNNNKPLKPEVSAVIPSYDTLLAQVLEHVPPFVIEDISASSGSSPLDELEDDEDF